MNTRRTYLDTLNAGRQRRSETSLEELSRSLEHLEQQLDLRERSLAPATQAAATHRAQPAYGRADPYTGADTISAELRALRDEMRQQVTAGLRQEFDALRRGLEQSQASLHGRGGDIGPEMERLADSIHSLTERNDDKALNVLRLELEQLKSAISALAREDTVRSVSARWDDIDRKLADLQANLGDLPDRSHADPALAALNERLDQIGFSVSQLPESLSIDRLEDKIRNLASAIEHFARQQERTEPTALAAIEGRLEEISRAIVASSMAPPAAVDPKPFERIESRLNALAHQLDAAERPTDEMIDRLTLLAQRVEDIAVSQSLPDKAVEKLGRQIAALTEKIADAVAAPDSSVLRDIELRLGEVARRLDQPPVRFSSASDEAILAMQKRLDYLAKKIDAGSKASDVDPALIQSLETQLGALSGFLANPKVVNPDIAPRLDRLEASLADSRMEIVKAAREAAEQAVRTFSGSQRDSVAVSGLTQDLKALEGLTRKSDERNAKTFEAIHDTLIKVVDRLSSIDAAPASDDPTPRVFGKAETPSLDIDDYEEPILKEEDGDSADARLSPAQAAATAAAALSEIEGGTEEETPRPRGLAALARGLRGKAAEPVNLPDSQPVPAVEPDAQLDPAEVNRPLEPGSRAPDLNAIMSRVREDRDATSRSDTEAARSDFIAAARRAAQAAAAEAEVLKRQADTGRNAAGRSRLRDMLKARKKPILMAAAAIVVALAGLQLSNSFLSDPKDISDENLARTQQDTRSEALAAQDVPSPQPAKAPADPVRVVGGEPGQQPKEPPAGAESKDADLGPVETTASTPEPAKSPDGPDATETEAAADAPIITAATPPVAPAAMPAAVEPIEVPADAGPVALRDAASSGDAKAMFEIGARYAEGRGAKADMAAAAEWYRKSADLGFAPAQYRIGNLYEKGNGVERDLKQAKTWYQMAADQGNASAMHNLAVLFATDAGQGADNESAARWFQKAAALGVKDSQFNLGILSAKGVGMPQNLEESYKWFALVAKTGDRDAAQKRDEIANSLRPEQLERARGMVDGWTPEPLDAAANSVDMPEGWRESNATTAGIDMKKAIRNVQALLNKAGYDAGTADGMMGDRTKKAIAAFRQDNGMEPSGTIDEQMVKALLAKN